MSSMGPHPTCKAVLFGPLYFHKLFGLVANIYKLKGLTKQCGFLASLRKLKDLATLGI